MLLLDSITRRIVRIEEDIRRLKLRQPATTGGNSEVETFIVGGSFDNTLYVPPAFVSVNPNGLVAETKKLYGVRVKLRLGSCRVYVETSLSGLFDFTDVTAGAATFFDLSSYDLTLIDGDELRTYVGNASTSPKPTDLSVGFIIVPG